MNKNRYLLYLLLSGLMLYYTLPRLSFNATGKESLFAVAWLLLALFVIAGNLYAYLYTPKKRRIRGKKAEIKSKKSRGLAN